MTLSMIIVQGKMSISLLLIFPNGSRDFPSLRYLH